MTAGVDALGGLTEAERTRLVKAMEAVHTVLDRERDPRQTLSERIRLYYAVRVAATEALIAELHHAMRMPTVELEDVLRRAELDAGEREHLRRLAGGGGPR